MTPIPIRVFFDGRLWRMASADGPLSGAFIAEAPAIRCAMAEAEAHPGYRWRPRPLIATGNHAPFCPEHDATTSA